MTRVDFADLIHQPLSLSREKPTEALVLKLLDTAWVQRLRDISQTANTKLVYMFAEHSRFGHSLGVAQLACILVDKLRADYQQEVEKYDLAICAAALLHDIGHLAPGSHTAVKTWFPDSLDKHEEVAARIIKEDKNINQILENTQKGLSREVMNILQESSDVPPWTWQILSGASWNVDRGNWCIVDSILAGVSYGKYNIGALLDSFLITDDGNLALRENRLDAMVHFALSRNAMYRQVYQHRVILAADTLNHAVVRRARDLADKVEYADPVMQKILSCKDYDQLTLKDVYQMRESWWRYHLLRWSESQDPILSDLANRIINRNLFKTVRIASFENDLYSKALDCLSKNGFDSRYYLHKVSSTDMISSDYHQPMLVQMEKGSLIPVTEADSMLSSLGKDSASHKENRKEWLVMPLECKEKLVSY